MKKYLLIFLITGLSQLKAQMPFEFIALEIDFENGADSIISFSNDSAFSTHWQIGQPSKINFDKAYSDSNAIVTDTLNIYMPNTITYFEVPFVPTIYPPYYSICPLQICFKHKIDIAGSSAGGWLDIRDNDQQHNIIENTAIFGTDYYYELVWPDSSYSWSDTLFNGEYGFNFSDLTWTETCYALSAPGMARNLYDTLYFRFNFVSDSSSNLVREGWMIDDIRIGKGFGGCGGGLEDQLNSSIILFPNPADEFAQVHFMNEFEKGSYEIVDLSGRTVLNANIQYAETVSIRTDLLESGTYFIRFNLDGKRGVKKLFKR